MNVFMDNSFITTSHLKVKNIDWIFVEISQKTHVREEIDMFLGVDAGVVVEFKVSLTSLTKVWPSQKGRTIWRVQVNIDWENHIKCYTSHSNKK